MLKFFKNFTKRDWSLVLCAIGFICVQVWLDLKLPDYMSKITVLVETSGSHMSEILLSGGKMLLCAFGSLLSSVTVAFLASNIGINTAANVREKLFRKVQDFSMEEIGKFSTASLITRTTNDVQQIQTLIVMGLQVTMKAPIMAVWAILKIYDKSWQWTFSTATAVIILICIVLICVSLATPRFKKMQTLTDDLNRVTRENLTGLNVVRAYNAEHYQEQKFSSVNDMLTSNNTFANRTMGFMLPCIQGIINGLTLAIYWIGALLINRAKMSGKLTLFSDMVVFSSYAMQVVMAFMMLVMIFILLPRASVAAKRIMEVLDTDIRIQDGSASGSSVVAAGTFDTTSAAASNTGSAVDLTTQSAEHPLCGEIEFQDVSFRYPDSAADVVEHISFKAEKGQTIAFIGSTGCGKSTVINLIPRFYDATDGTVLVDGLNVKDYRQTDLRNKIGYVSQKVILFSGDISSNIAYGDNGNGPISDEDIKSAISVAQATDFVEKEDGAYKAYVAQGGSNFSGGQKQRLSIARAIARKPEILIFDDSFSALDYRTDRLLRQALHNQCADTTKIIVAQRIGTIRDADQIIVLDHGRIAGQGTHQELMDSCEVYQQIAYSQLSKEELA